MLKSLGIKEVIALLSFLGGVVMFIYGLGFKNAMKETNNAELITKIDTLDNKIMKLGVIVNKYGKSISEIQHAKEEEDTKLAFQRANFVTLEKSYLESLKLIDRINLVVKYYEQKQRYQDSVARTIKHGFTMEQIK